MSAIERMAAMAAARHLLHEKNPQLVAWSRSRWDAWIVTQREGLRPASAAGIIATASISCLADLALHAGLMQLLNSGCTVVLSLPTEAAARLARAQARRDEWEGLGYIVTDAQWRGIADNLPDNTAVAMFKVPSLLPADAVARASRAGQTGHWSQGNQFAEHDAFLGSAADLRSWRALRRQTHFSLEPLRSILRHGGHDLPTADEPANSPSLTLQPLPTSAARDWPHGRIAFAGMRPGDEILVETIGQNSSAGVFLRRRAEVVAANPNVSVRVPAKLLTTSPQTIRFRRTERDAERRPVELLLRVPPSQLQPWMLAAFLNRGGGGNPVIRAFAKGVGCRITYAEDEPAILRDVPVVWGVLRDSDRILAQAKVQGLYFFYIDHAYFDRGHGKSYRITRNGYEAGRVRRCPNDRISTLNVTVEPWRKSGREVVVCPPTEYFMIAHGCADWLETTLAELRQVTDRPIVVREKPRPGDAVVPLPQALKTAHALVTHSSNVAIEAACLGTPVFVSPTSAAAPVGRTELSKLEEPRRPDREQWLAHLAYNQFSLEEISDGSAWRMLLELEERDFA